MDAETRQRVRVERDRRKRAAMAVVMRAGVEHRERYGLADAVTLARRRASIDRFEHPRAA